MRCLRRCESVGFSGNGGRSSRGDWGGDDVKRAEKWLNNRELEEGLEDCVRDTGEVERMPTWDVSGRMGDDLTGLKVLKNRSRGRNRRIMDMELK